jgi:hypothetical protein
MSRLAQTNALFGVVASQVQHNASSSSLREKSVLRPLQPTSSQTGSYDSLHTTRGVTRTEEAHAYKNACGQEHDCSTTRRRCRNSKQNSREITSGFQRGPKAPEQRHHGCSVHQSSCRTQKALMIEQGFNLETSTVKEFVEISERAKTKDNIYQERKRFFNSNDNSSSDDERHRKKKQTPPKARNYQSNSDRKEFCCEEHGPNSTHNSSDCKVIHGKQADEQSWKNKDKLENKCSDHKSKHKNKSCKLNLLQMEMKRVKAKWTKACKKLQANHSSSSESEGEQFQDHLELKSVKETVRKEDPEVFNLDSSSSSSSSDSDSE